MSKKVGIISGLGIAAIAGLTLTYSSIVGHNDSGYRQFVQTYTGSTKVEFTAGPFTKWFGFSEPYKDVITFDATNPDGRCEFERGDGFKVQYGDGGWGVICGQIQFPLTNDEATMKAMHKRYRSEEGIRTKLIDRNLRGIMTTTAELFTSTEAYSTKRSQIGQYINEQILNGSFNTTTEEREITVGFDESTGKDIMQKKLFSVIVPEGDKYSDNPLEEWGMNTGVKFTVTGFDFEEKTITQIGLRRDANNRAETAQDQAKAAYWETKRAEAEGEKQRVEAEYREKVKAETAIQQAERDKQLAIIEAKKQEEQAVLLTKAAIAATEQKKQEVLQAQQEAVKVKTLADAEAYALKEKQKAGELKLKLDAMVAMNADNARAQAERAVPQTVIYSGDTGNLGSGDDVNRILDTQLIKNLEALQLNHKVKSK